MSTTIVPPVNALVEEDASAVLARLGNAGPSCLGDTVVDRLADHTRVEQVRIQAHLDRVATLLKKERVATGGGGSARFDSPNRARLLATLEDYSRRGEFPQWTITTLAAKHECQLQEEGDAASYQCNGRCPIFIDDAGTPCAVGHLMMQSGPEGRSLAEDINRNPHLRFALIGDLLQKDADVRIRTEAWCDRHGFAPTELAMIQPSYQEGFGLTEARIKTLTGKTVTLSYSEEEGRTLTFRRLKELFQEKEGVPPDELRLIAFGNEYPDDQCVYDIAATPVKGGIHAVLRLRGGPPAEDEKEE